MSVYYNHSSLFVECCSSPVAKVVIHLLQKNQIWVRANYLCSIKKVGFNLAFIHCISAQMKPWPLLYRPPWRHLFVCIFFPSYFCSPKRCLGIINDKNGLQSSSDVALDAKFSPLFHKTLDVVVFVRRRQAGKNTQLCVLVYALVGQEALVRQRTLFTCVKGFWQHFVLRCKRRKLSPNSAD